jgi:hypothetical protein
VLSVLKMSRWTAEKRSCVTDALNEGIMACRVRVVSKCQLKIIPNLTKVQHSFFSFRVFCHRKLGVVNGQPTDLEKPSGGVLKISKHFSVSSEIMPVVRGPTVADALRRASKITSHSSSRANDSSRRHLSLATFRSSVTCCLRPLCLI